MKHLDEYRNSAGVRQLAQAIARTTKSSWNLMEICGGQTHSIVRFGLDQLLPPQLQLIHGPGCPVCVTPIESIDKAIAIAARPEVTLCTFGDMLRVPGSASDLFRAKSQGADVRVVYSPIDAVAIARAEPSRQVVFFAVGFETTAPGNALAVREAHRLRLENFSAVVSHVLVPPALEAILSSPGCAIDGFLAAGHVCTVMGTTQYAPLSFKHRVPIVVAGFEPIDLMTAIHACVKQLEEGRAELENRYQRLVRPEGNREAQALVSEVFEVEDRAWRGIGRIPASGLGLREAYSAFDAVRRFHVEGVGGAESTACRSGEVLLGRIKPTECAAFGSRCTPENPLGAPMVSGEGACAAYHRYRRHEFV